MQYFSVLRVSGERSEPPVIQSGEGKRRLSQNYAFNKKCTIFTQSLRNFAKKRHL